MKTFLILLFICLTVAPALAADKAKAEYHMYGPAPTGSHIPVKLASSNVPFDKNYSELSKEERAIVRADYKGILASDVPPYPARGVADILRPLSSAHSSMLARGEMLVVAMISAEGTVTEIRIYKTPTETIGQIIAASLYQAEFTPGTCSGAPCAMEYLLDQEFLASR